MKLRCGLLITFALLCLSAETGCFYPPTSVRIRTQIATFGPVKIIHPGSQESEVRLDATYPGIWDAVIVVGDDRLTLKEATPQEFRAWQSRHPAMDVVKYRFGDEGKLIEIQFPIEPSSELTLIVHHSDRSITLPCTISELSGSGGDDLTISELVQEARCDSRWAWPWDK